VTLGGNFFIFSGKNLPGQTLYNVAQPPSAVRVYRSPERKRRDNNDMEEGDQINENAFRKTNPNFPYILFILPKKLFTKRSQIYISICEIWFHLFSQNEPKCG